MSKVPPPPPAAAELPATTTVTAVMNKRRKKKGRPSLVDLQKRNQSNQQQQENQNSLITSSSSGPNLTRRSTRQNPLPEVGDDDDERKEKKVKLVVRLPQSNHQPEEQHFDNLPRSSSLNSGSSSSDSDEEGDNPGASTKKRKINAVTDRSGDNPVEDQQEKVTKATDPVHGSASGSGPTPLPDKKLLVFILDRLQKKDTYGVFSEPVDPNELPDYHEIIEHPMDFGTVRKKLDTGTYSNLEQLEGCKCVPQDISTVKTVIIRNLYNLPTKKRFVKADVFLICSNAMQYNSSDTVYFRRARSIQELAKRDFENLRHEGEDGELRPKVVRRGRPPSKHLKRPPSNTSVDCIGPELSAGATPPPVEENTNGSTAYNLRKAPMLYKFQTTDSVLPSRRPRNGENYSESADWNDEFPASIVKADMKHGRKLDLIDETRRETYKQFQRSAFGREPSLLSDFGGDTKQLMPVGLHVQHGYARSLARFAADLGPVAWKFASKKLGSVLPPGLKFGPGFVGETEAPLESPFFLFRKQKPLSSLACDGDVDGNRIRSVTPSTTGVNPAISSGFQGKKDAVELDTRLSSQNEVAVSQDTPLPGIITGQTIHTQNKPAFHSERNGFNGVFGCNFPSQTGLVQAGMPAGQSDPEGASEPTQPRNMVPKGDTSSTSPSVGNSFNSEHKCSDTARTSNHGISVAPNTRSEPHTMSEGRESPSWQALMPHPRQYSVPVQPDLNVRLQAPGSPSSGLRVGSPHQPDLALQL